MKKYSLSALIAFAMLFCVSLFTGCSDSTAMGTSEEGNEVAEKVSSSSNVASSSSGDSKELHIKSCSSRAVSSSSRKPGIYAPETGSSSSEDKLANEGSAKPNSLAYYLILLHLESGSFDNAVLSTKRDYDKDSDQHGETQAPKVSEFDGPWPHKVVKQNVVALEKLFPTAAQDFSDIITAIKNETLDKKCGLYTFNVYGDGVSAAFVVANIAKDTIKVLDVPAGKCNAMSSNEMSRFLFYYCGELDNYPEIVHVPVENSLSAKCSAFKSEDEWVKENKN
jgi:hypothetical protein